MTPAAGTAGLAQQTHIVQETGVPGDDIGRHVDEAAGAPTGRRQLGELVQVAAVLQHLAR